MTFDVINYNSLYYGLTLTEENMPMLMYYNKEKIWKKQAFEQYEYELELSKKLNKLKLQILTKYEKHRNYNCNLLGNYATSTNHCQQILLRAKLQAQKELRNY
jgi:hypothetical protein